MENVLIISSSKAAAQSLAAFFRETFSCTPKAVESAYQANSFFEKDPSVELAVINSPLMDGSGIELAEHITSDTVSCCILIMKRENAEKISERAEKKRNNRPRKTFQQGSHISACKDCRYNYQTLI